MKEEAYEALKDSTKKELKENEKIIFEWAGLERGLGVLGSETSCKHIGG